MALILMYIVFPCKLREIDSFFDRAVNAFAKLMGWTMEVGTYNLSVNSYGHQNGLTGVAKKKVMNPMLSDAQHKCMTL